MQQCMVQPMAPTTACVRHVHACMLHWVWLARRLSPDLRAMVAARFGLFGYSANSYLYEARCACDEVSAARPRCCIACSMRETRYNAHGKVSPFPLFLMALWARPGPGREGCMHVCGQPPLCGSRCP